MVTMTNPFSIRLAIRDIPIPRKLTFVIGLFCAVIVCLLTLSYFGMDILSSGRAYVGGEGLWSKAQKQAVIQLGRYAWSGEPKEYENFLSALKIPLGDRQARLELEKPDFNWQTAAEGFSRGGNDPQDIPGMIQLMRRFGTVSYLRRASDKWRQADAYLSQLQAVGEDIHREVLSGRRTSPQMQAFLMQAQEISTALTPVEDDFSVALGEGARWLKSIVFFLMSLATGLVLAMALAIAHLISKHLCEEIDALRKGASRIAGGDYSIALNTESKDEIGDLARTFQWMAEQRREAERLREEFFSNVSHELRTPLTLILSPVESLLPDPRFTDPALQSTLQTVHNNAVRLLQLVNGLLDFSKLGAGEIHVRREPCSIAKLTASVYNDFQPLIRAQNLISRLEVDAGDSLVMMDRYLYERILFNLLSNAVKFTSAQGRLDVRVKWSDGRLTLSVSDTGIGIAPGDRETIFKRFRQVEGASTRRFEGTGLGLALVKEFAALLEGTVAVESTVGKGSTFTVTCAAPAATGSAEKAVAELTPWRTRPQQYNPAILSAADSTQERASAKVLIAEDNMEMAAHIASILQPICWTKIVRDGNAALEAVRAWSPDLILTDVMMPKSDGLALCREVKSNLSTLTIPVIMLTALTHREALLEGWKAGADEYLFKPFHPEELVARVRSLLAARQKRQLAEEALRSGLKGRENTSMITQQRHQCMIYDGPPTMNLIHLVPLLLQKLQEGYRCVFLGSPTMVARMQYELASAGVEVSSLIAKGKLILSSSQDYLVKGQFDTVKMLGMLDEMVNQAVKDGFKGLWATGDMTWEFGTEKNLSKLLEYECGLEKMFQTHPELSGVCQYHRDTLPGHILRSALLTHPSIFISHTLQRVNPYYVPPDALLSAKPKPTDQADIDQMIRGVTHPGNAA